MNRKILQKIIDCLATGTPDKISYALGMLDALMESLPEEKPVLATSQWSTTYATPQTTMTTASSNEDPAEFLDKQAKAKLDDVKKRLKYE